MLEQGSDISGHLHPNYVPHFDERLFERQIGHEHFLDHQQQPHQHQHHEHHQGLDHATASDFQMPHLDVPPHERSLDSHPSRSARLVGETGEANPYLLRRYHYDANDECTIAQTHYRRVRPRPSASSHPTGKDAPPPVFTLATDSASLTAEPRAEDHVLAQARYDISQLFTSEQSFRLLGLYFRFVDPYLPILARSSIFVNGLISRTALDALPLSLTAALYATALPYIPYDALLAPSLSHVPDPSTQLYRTAHLALTHELHNPRPATLQAALLLLHRPAQHTPFRPALIATTVSLAHSLGLSHDPTSWTLPAPELALRKRLWHAVLIADKWTALTLGTPSCIRTDDADVAPLWPADLEPALGPDDGSDASTNFRLLADLSSIVADILDNYFSVRATQRTASNFALSLDLGRGLRARLDAWSEGLPRALFVRGAPVRRGGGDAGLYLGYLVANMTLFRGLMRPLEGGGGGQEMGMGMGGSGGAVRAGARECAEEAVVFVEGLAGAGGVEGFWHSCMFWIFFMEGVVIYTFFSFVPSVNLPFPTPLVPSSCSSFVPSSLLLPTLLPLIHLSPSVPFLVPSTRTPLVPSSTPFRVLSHALSQFPSTPPVLFSGSNSIALSVHPANHFPLDHIIPLSLPATRTQANHYPRVTRQLWHRLRLPHTASADRINRR